MFVGAGGLVAFSALVVADIASGIALAPIGVAFLALGIFLFFWNPETEDLFGDDWVDMAQVGASLAAVLAGVGLVIAAFV